MKRFVVTLSMVLLALIVCMSSMVSAQGMGGLTAAQICPPAQNGPVNQLACCNGRAQVQGQAVINAPATPVTASASASRVVVNDAAGLTVQSQTTLVPVTTTSTQLVPVTTQNVVAVQNANVGVGIQATATANAAAGGGQRLGFLARHHQAAAVRHAARANARGANVALAIAN